MEMILPPGDVRQCLEIFLVVTVGLGDAAGTPGMLLNNLKFLRQPPHQRIICIKMSIVKRLRSSDPKYGTVGTLSNLPNRWYPCKFLNFLAHRSIWAVNLVQSQNIYVTTMHLAQEDISKVLFV